MNNIVDALRVFGKKLTGTDVTSDTIANSIGEIAENYTGGGSGGSDIPVLEFVQTGNFSEMGYFSAVCNTENVDWLAVKNRIDSGKPVDAYFASEFVKDQGHSGGECDVFRLAAVNTYGPGSIPWIAFIFRGASSNFITITVNSDTAEIEGHRF